MPFFRRNQLQRRWLKDLPLGQSVISERQEHENTYENAGSKVTTRVPVDAKRFPDIQGENPIELSNKFPVSLTAGEPFTVDIREYTELSDFFRVYITQRPYWISLEDEYFIVGNVPSDVTGEVVIEVLIETQFQRGTISFVFTI